MGELNKEDTKEIVSAASPSAPKMPQKGSETSMSMMCMKGTYRFNKFIYVALFFYVIPWIVIIVPWIMDKTVRIAVAEVKQDLQFE